VLKRTNLLKLAFDYFANIFDIPLMQRSRMKGANVAGFGINRH
jgi:hypothetical protein